MMTQELAGMLKEDGLQHVGEIIAQVNVRAFLRQKCDWVGGVYVWVALDAEGSPLYARYVGRHSKSLTSRIGQHNGGFRSGTGSKTGKKNAGNIRGDLSAGVSKFRIYAAASEDPKVAEAALMQRYGAHWKLWNVAGKRKLRAA